MNIYRCNKLVCNNKLLESFSIEGHDAEDLSVPTGLLSTPSIQLKLKIGGMINNRMKQDYIPLTKITGPGEEP